MTLYTSKVVAAWLGISERRVRQLRDNGVLPEAQQGLFDLKATVTRYINFLGGDARERLNEERAKLIEEKRKAAQRENRIQENDLHKSEDIERGLKTIFLNIRSRFLSLPAKLAPKLASISSQAEVFDELKSSINETLEELENYDVALAADQSEDSDEDPDDSE